MGRSWVHGSPMGLLVEYIAGSCPWVMPPVSEMIVFKDGRPRELPLAPMVSRGVPRGTSWASAASHVGAREILRNSSRKPTGVREISPGIPRESAGSHGKNRSTSRGSARGTRGSHVSVRAGLASGGARGSPWSPINPPWDPTWESTREPAWKPTWEPAW